jgi:hypothetical protein
MIGSAFFAGGLVAATGRSQRHIIKGYDRFQTAARIIEHQDAMRALRGHSVKNIVHLSVSISRIRRSVRGTMLDMYSRSSRVCPPSPSTPRPSSVGAKAAVKVVSLDGIVPSTLHLQADIWFA